MTTTGSASPALLPLSTADKRRLLQLVRAALEAFVRGQPNPAVDPLALPPALREPASCFVTLFHRGALRGCVGGLERDRPLYHEACLRACHAAELDERFPPVSADELPQIEIEVSILSTPEPLVYDRPADLPRLLRPGVDGLIIGHGRHRVTFLPQVWSHVPDPEAFVSRLCEKLGVPPHTWRLARQEAARYTVEHFSETDLPAEPGLDNPLPR